MRWSKTVRLTEAIHVIPSANGIYEIGYLRGIFRPRYIEIADKQYTMRGILQSQVSGNLVNNFLFDKIEASLRDELYVRWMRPKDPTDTYDRLRARHEYRWNSEVYKIRQTNLLLSEIKKFLKKPRGARL